MGNPLIRIMRSCLFSALIAFVATVVLPASPTSAQTVRDSVRMTLSIYTFYNSYVIGDTPRAACGAGVVAPWRCDQCTPNRIRAHHAHRFEWSGSPTRA